MDVVVENLTKSFGYQKAVDSVSFEVKKGEILGFLGPNGAGKTTTLKIMSCFLFPDYGNIRIGKYSIHKNPYKIKQIIGYLPEHNPLYEEMNVIDFLDFIARVHNIPKYKIIPKVMDMIRMCGLDNEKHKTIRELSKGYRQRVGLAQALIHDPEVLLLDEPTNGLDPQGIIEIRELILRLNREEGITVLISSHILDELSRLATHCGIIDGGRMVKELSAAELDANCRKALRVRVSDIRALTRVLDARGLDYAVANDHSADIYAELAVSDLVHALDAENCALLSAETRDESLESYFISLVGGERHA